MQAPFATQQLLVELAAVDAQLAGLRFKDKNLPEQDELDNVRAQERAAREGVARARIRLEDVNRAHAKAKGERDSLATREKGTLAALEDPQTPEAQRRELRHDVTAVARLLDQSQAHLDELESERAAAHADLEHEGATIDALAAEVAAAEQRRLNAIGDIEAKRTSLDQTRESLLERIPTELLGIYSQVAVERGAGAGQLVGRHCGACHIELDNTTLATFGKQPLDAVLRCPECRAILVRPEGTQPGIAATGAAGSR